MSFRPALYLHCRLVYQKNTRKFKSNPHFILKTNNSNGEKHFDTFCTRINFTFYLMQKVMQLIFVLPND